MKKIIALLLCIGLVFSLSACNNKDGIDKNKDQTVNGASASDENIEVENGENAAYPDDAASMLQVMEALITTEMGTDLEYGVWNTDFVWTACTMLLGSEIEGVAYEDDGQRVKVSSDVVKQCVNAMFAGYNGNKQELPEVTVDSVIYDEDAYLFEKGDYGDQTLKVSSCKISEAGVLDVIVELYNDSDSVSSGRYHVIMEKTTYTASENLIFNYMVDSFEAISTYADFIPSEGEITEEEALALVEQIYGEDGKPDEQTGNIITYGLESMETLDGKTYYNFRMSWLVLNEEGIPDHSSYLNNVFVCTDGSEILDVFLNMDGAWEVMED